MATTPMFSPDGQLGDIPASKVRDAVKAGFKLGVDMSSPTGEKGTIPVDRIHDAIKAGFSPFVPNEAQAAAKPPVAPIPKVDMEMNPFGSEDLPGSFEGHPENIGGYVADTGSVIGSGAMDLSRGNIARGTHKLVQGAGLAALPMMPFVAASAPAAFAVGTGMGIGGQKTGKYLGDAIGLTPDQSDVAGDALGLAGGYLGSKLPSAVSRLKAPLGETVTKPRGTIPPEQYTPAELKAYADHNGIPLNAAQATEHNLPRNLQSAGERSTVGGTAVRQQNRASQAAVAQHAENLMDTFSPHTPDLASAGDTIQKNVEVALENQQAASQQQYAAIDKQAAGVAVDLAPVKRQAANILANSEFLRKAGLDPKSATRIMQGIENVPDKASFSDAQKMRSALLDASRSPELAISNTAQGMLKQAIKSTDDAMMTAAKSKPGLEQTFRAANDQWKQLQEDFNSPRSPLAQILVEADPSKVPQKLAQRGQIGGSPYNAQLLDRYGIDKGPIKRVILQDLLGKDFRLWNKNLGGYSDDFLKSIFSPDELTEVYKTGAIARSVGINTNPSGTAGVSGAMEDVQKPMRSMLPKGLAAKATKSPAVNRWMMKSSAGQSRKVPLSALLGVVRSNNDDQ